MGVFKFHGHIDKNFDKELNKSDAIIVCNNIDLGNRVRILTALSNMTLVVTHRANIKGIPELIHDYNCLVGNNIDEIVEICLNLKKNLNRNYIIKNNALKTAQRNFSFNAFKRMIRDKIKKNFL
jgi:glycosyltransferase involved in cell wall biosynthesis